MLESFFILNNEVPANIVAGTYQPLLVVCSYVIASLAAYVALSILRQVDINNKTSLRNNQLLGAFVMGLGIWSMHFVGMMAFQMNMAHTYDVGLTLFSMLVAVIFSYVVFHNITRNVLKLSRILFNAPILGLGIASMHYVGMDAMRMDGVIKYYPGLFILSVVIAIIASGVAIWIMRFVRDVNLHQEGLQLIASLILGLAVCGMHYTGMAAAAFIPFADCKFSQDSINMNLLTVVLLINFIIICIGLFIAGAKRNLAESKIKEQSNFLNTVIENIPLCFFAKDASDGYRWVIWNKKSIEVFGLSGEDVLGKTDYDNFPKEEADFFRATDEKVMREGKLVDIPEEPVTTGRGTWPAHTIKVPVYDAKGNPKILIGILEDITERKRHQDALKVANADLYNEKTRLETIMDSIPEGIIIINENGIINHTNPGAEKMFGYHNEEMIGKNIKILVPMPDKNLHDSYLAHYRSTKEVKILGQNRQLMGERKDSTVFPVNITIKSMVINGETMFIGIVRDVTEQINREKELEAARSAAESANRLKSEFLANMSHELRTPMHSIISFSRQGISHIKDWDAERQEGNLKLIHESGERLLLLINDLLDLSKLEAGAFEYKFDKHDIADIMNLVIRQNQPIISEKKIKIEFVKDEALPLIECDNAKTSQVILNLLSNALKFTPAGKIIKIYASQDSASLKLVVEDEGIGIPEDELESVFDKFIQSSKTKSGAGGTGLGLAICKEIIEEGHGGRIWAENKPDSGARFILTMPFSQSDKGGG